MPDFGSTPTSTRSLGINQFPVSAAFVPNSDVAGGLTSIEGIAVNTDSNGYTTTAIRMGLKNGDDVTQGNTTDAAVTGDTAGTLSAKMRGLNKILADVWDSTNHRVKVDGSGVTQPVSAATTAIADLAALTTAQGATSGAQTGPIIQGLVTTNGPTYTTGTIQPISISTNGSLRVQSNISGSGIVGGNGTTSAQTQRVTLSSDSTGQVALAAGSALVGGTYLVDSGGTNKAAVDASGKQSFKAATGDVADLAALTTAQGAASASQTGPIIQGLVTTNNPAYTTGTIQPISITTNGSLRVLQSISGASIVGGNGTTTAQTQRVTLSSDSTGVVGIQVGGSAVATTNPVPSADQIRLWSLAGNAYSATTGKQTAAAGTNNVGMSVFMAAGSNKNLLIYSAVITYAVALAGEEATAQTIDPALSGLTISAVNQKGGGSAGAASVTGTNNTGVSVTGTAFAFSAVAANQYTEMFPTGSCYFVPSGTAGGVSVYIPSTGANNWTITMRWIEY